MTLRQAISVYSGALCTNEPPEHRIMPQPPCYPSGFDWVISRHVTHAHTPGDDLGCIVGGDLFQRHQLSFDVAAHRRRASW